MLYLISCVVVYIASVLSLKKLGLLPVIGKDRYTKDQIIVSDTVGTMGLMLIGALVWPISVPIGALILYVLKPKNEKESK